MPGSRLDLKVRIALRVAALGAICFVAAVVCVLVTANRAARERADSISDLVARELGTQWERSQWVKSAAIPFPDLQTLAQAVTEPGLCIAYRTPDGRPVQRLCEGIAPADAAVPAMFTTIYQRLFGFGTESTHAVRFGTGRPGAAVASIDSQRVIGQGWRETRVLIGLLAATLFVLCLLIYAVLAYALRPTRTIRAGLARLAAGDLSTRLPPFDLAELSAVGEVFNTLADQLDRALAERRILTQRLIAVQDDERRHLARELHDEFGQCLAAISAMAASAAQTARHRCPELLPECEHMSRTSAHMRDILRSALLRLRPPEVEELGLAAGLEGLVAGWNGRRSGTRFSIEISGHVDDLPPHFCSSVYRIAQEAITNAAKHADASHVQLRLTRRDPSHSGDPARIELDIDDNGKAGEDSVIHSGMGLLGIRERIEGLGGQLAIQLQRPSGLALRVQIPLPSQTDRGHVRLNAA
jgi:signal transduction histidine kinase